MKVVIRDAETGAWVREAKVAHPEGTEVDAGAWWSALRQAMDGLMDGVVAAAVAGQQHGLVTLDERGQFVRPALLWNDTRSAQDADDLVTELGGPTAWAEAVGSVPLAAFTVAKARWVARNEPELAQRVATILLPHDYLTWELAGRPAQPTTDRGDASGTGYWSPSQGEYRLDLLERALGHVPNVPRVATPAEIVGHTPDGIALAPGTGDNMGAAFALGIGPGDVVISLGTSGTAFAGSDRASADPTGLVAGFADASGAFLPLVCTLNAARILTSSASMLGVDVDGLARLALAAAPGAGGLSLLPYFDGERTPNLPDARGSLHGITRGNLSPENIARASIEGMLGGMADAVDALVAVGVVPQRILLVGGAAANEAVSTIASTLFDVPIEVPPPGEYVADGAARQAAWAWSGSATPPAWEQVRAGATRRLDPDLRPEVRAAYARARSSLYG